VGVWVVVRTRGRREKKVTSAQTVTAMTVGGNASRNRHGSFVCMYGTVLERACTLPSMRRPTQPTRETGQTREPAPTSATRPLPRAAAGACAPVASLCYGPCAPAPRRRRPPPGPSHHVAARHPRRPRPHRHGRSPAHPARAGSVPCRTLRRRAAAHHRELLRQGGRGGPAARVVHHPHPRARRRRLPPVAATAGRTHVKQEGTHRHHLGAQHGPSQAAQGP